MYSFAFPNMVGETSSNLLRDKDAIRSNLMLLLNSERLSLFGDPGVGTALKKVIFEQSTSLITDLLIDEIYTTIVVYMPHLYIERRDIQLYTDGLDVFAKLFVTYRHDNTSDMYSIKLTSEQEEI